MPQIDYYFATLSPYCYLAGLRLEDVAQKHGATIHYKPFDIISAFGRTGGTLPKDRHTSRMEYRAQELPRQAKKVGLPFNLKPAHWPTNGAPAAYAFIAAQNAGGGDLGKLAHVITRSVWADEKDIAQDDAAKGGWVLPALTSRARTRPAAARSGTSSTGMGATSVSSFSSASDTEIMERHSGLICHHP